MIQNSHFFYKKRFLECARMLGGKYVSKGSYGCVFTPALKCKGKIKKISNPSDDLSYSKIILDENAEEEFSIGQRISKIPLWKNYFIISESICTPAKKQTEPELNKCTILQDHIITDFRILHMPAGGVPFSRWRTNMESFDFMRFVTHLIEAGALLNLFGIVHRDLHGGNILINDDIPKIIDYNLSVDVKQTISTEELHMHLRHRHEINLSQESPDATLVNAVSVFGHKPNIIIESIIYKKHIIDKIVNTLNVDRHDMIKSLETFYYKNKDVKASNCGEWFHGYWRTIDSWSIGVIILELIHKLSLWSDFYVILNKHKSKLFPILKKLCAVSPIERIDCVQALHYLDPQHFIIRKYAKDWLTKIGYGNI